MTAADIPALWQDRTAVRAEFKLIQVYTHFVDRGSETQHLKQKYALLVSITSLKHGRFCQKRLYLLITSISPGRYRRFQLSSPPADVYMRLSSRITATIISHRAPPSNGCRETQWLTKPANAPRQQCFWQSQDASRVSFRYTMSA